MATTTTAGKNSPHIHISVVSNAYDFAIDCHSSITFGILSTHTKISFRFQFSTEQSNKCKYPSFFNVMPDSVYIFICA